MIIALHCQLSSSFLSDGIAFGKLLIQSLPNIKVENIFLTSTDTAIVWVADDDVLEEIISRGKSKAFSVEKSHLFVTCRYV